MYNNEMKVIGFIISFFLCLLGIVFLLSAFHPDAVASGKSMPRLLVGILLILGGTLLDIFIILAWKQAMKSKSVGSLEQGIPGKLSFKALTCLHCGAQVDRTSIEISPEGNMTAKCGYCNGVFVVNEDPKW